VKDLSAFKQSETHISSYLYLAKSYVKPQCGHMYNTDPRILTCKFL